MSKQVDPKISEYYRKLGKKSAEARHRKILEKAQKEVEIIKN